LLDFDWPGGTGTECARTLAFSKELCQESLAFTDSLHFQ